MMEALLEGGARAQASEGWAEPNGERGQGVAELRARVW